MTVNMLPTPAARVIELMPAIVLCPYLVYIYVHDLSVCCRILSLSDTCKSLMAETGQAKMLLPMLTSKNNATRWLSRQVSSVGSLSSQHDSL